MKFKTITLTFINDGYHKTLYKHINNHHQARICKMYSVTSSTMTSFDIKMLLSGQPTDVVIVLLFIMEYLHSELLNSSSATNIRP